MEYDYLHCNKDRLALDTCAVLYFPSLNKGE